MYITKIFVQEGKKEKVTLHRFLYECYHNTIIPKEIVIDHIDDNAFNNAIENLQMLTVAQNSAKATSHPIRLNFTDGTSKDFSSIKEAAEYYGIFATHITRSAKHGTKTHGYRWEYIE